MIHIIKCHPEPFAAIKAGTKNFEYRFNDRDYALGDRLVLSEWDPVQSEWTGEEIEKQIDYLVSDCFGIPPGYVVISWKSNEHALISALKESLEGMEDMIEYADERLDVLNGYITRAKEAIERVSTPEIPDN